MALLLNRVSGLLQRLRNPLHRLRRRAQRYPFAGPLIATADGLYRRIVRAETIGQVFSPKPALDINLMLHEARSAFLRAIPPNAERLLSAGCSGGWYFDWVERCYGPVSHHIGVEYYVDPPANLPPHVTWVRNTVGNMSEVEAASCDLIFSGQNIEHLWPDEVSGFLLEAARILRPGGHLVLDSPNRALTAALGWSHPEHTIELTPAEVTGLLQLAGFDVTAMKGIYLCRDPRTGRVLGFDPNQPDPEFSVTERFVGAVHQPEHSFIWWAEAVRTARTPDPDAVRDLTKALFDAHWPERTQRLSVAQALAITATPDHAWVEVPDDHGGPVLFGPSMPLPAGHYRCTWSFRPGVPVSGAATCDVMAGNAVLASATLGADQQHLSVTFALPVLTFAMQFRCLASGGTSFAVQRRVVLERLE